MTLRLVAAAAALATVAAPGAAQVSVLATHTEHGATAGRSPHKLYRPIEARSGCAPRIAPSVPGGRLPHYGAPIGVADCAAPSLAQTQYGGGAAED